MTRTSSPAVDFAHTAYIKAADLYLLLCSAEVLLDVETDPARKEALELVITNTIRALEEAGIRLEE